MILSSIPSLCPHWGVYRGPDGLWLPPRSEGLARVLAKAGYGSRLRTEAMVRAGRVTIAGRVVRDPGHAVGPDSAIHLDGEVLREAERRYFVVNKPGGLDCAQLHDAARWIMPPQADLAGLEPAGRLDVRARGLLLLSNDLWWNTQVSQNATLVSGFEVLVSGQLSTVELDVVRAGMTMAAHGAFKPLRAEIAAQQDTSTLVRIDARGGHIRQVRAAFVSLRRRVLSLVRVALGPVDLQGLSSGRHRALNAAEVRALAGRQRGRP